LIIGEGDGKKRKKIRRIVVAVYSSQNETKDLAQPHHPATHMICHSYSQYKKSQDL
jgi:hypothetical protein